MLGGYVRVPTGERLTERLLIGSDPNRHHGHRQSGARPCQLHKISA